MKQADKDSFIELALKAFWLMRCQANGNSEKQNALDLIKAIFNYRDFPDKNNYLKEYPELAGQKSYIDMLWKHFSGLSQEALGDLVIECIHEIYES